MKSSEELKEIYDEDYVESYKRKSPVRLERLIKYMTIDSTSNVADFACGNSLLMGLIAPKVNSYIGIDFSEPFIKAANEKKERLLIKNAEFVCADINEFCQQHKNAFDVGFTMDFSEHVYDQEWVQILRSIRKSLKPNGKLYLHTPNAEFFLEKMKNKNVIVKQLSGHVAVRTPEHNVALLREAGFNVAKVWLIPHYNIFRLVHPFSYIPVLGKYLKARIFIEATA